MIYDDTKTKFFPLSLTANLGLVFYDFICMVFLWRDLPRSRPRFEPGMGGFSGREKNRLTAVASSSGASLLEQ